MPRPREYPDDLGQRLLDAAAHLLATEGPGALSTRRVSAEVGTSTTAIYSLLGSKHELVRALYVEGFRRLGVHLAQVETTDDPLADLGALGLAYHRSATDNPEFYDVMFGSPVPEFTPSPADGAFALTTLQVLIDAVGRCVDAGVFIGDAADIARELWAVNHGVTSLGLTGMLGSAEAVENHLVRVTSATVAGYRSTPRGADDPGLSGYRSTASAAPMIPA